MSCIFSGKLQAIPDSCVPPLIPDFVGRVEECAAVCKSLTPMRIFSIWGSPGFGKTSTAIAIGNQLKCQGRCVYYFSFRGVNTMKEFFSKLLGLFGQATELNRDVIMSPADEILRAFGRMNTRVFLILDNLDDLLTSSDKKEGVLNFITDVLHRCPNVFFLTTTRESLEFISYRVKEFDSLRLKPLDMQSSQSLIRKFLPATTSVDIQSQILTMCGNVPLAIRLLCNLIKDSPGELLDEICHGSEGLLDVLDDPNHLSYDARLKQLIQVTFNKLSTAEKEAFVSLSVFDGAGFELDAGIAVLGGGQLQAKRNIENLKRKSLIDSNGDCEEMYALHPLIQSFASQKGEEDMGDVLVLSKARFLQFYINLFYHLNLRFLKGDSMAAFKTFFKEEKRILSSLTNGLVDDVLLKKIVDILQTCEFFLDSLYPNSLVEIELLYESALSKVSDRNIDSDIAGLYTSKHFYATTYVSRANSILSPEDDVMSRRISLLPLSVQGKLKCYKGIYELSNRGGKAAAQLIEDGLLQLRNNPEHVILKILAIQFLSIHYKCIGNSAKFKQFCDQAVETCSVNSAFPLLPLVKQSQENSEELDALPSNHPLIIWTIARISLWARHYHWLELDSGLSNMLCEYLKKISRLSMTAERYPLLQLCDMAYIHLCISNHSSDVDTTIEGLENFEDVKIEGERYRNAEDVENARKQLKLHDERLATCYHTIAVQRFGNGESAVELFLKELEIRQQLPPDAKLAECYRCIGKEQDSKGEYTSALEAYTSALKTLQKVYGEMHIEVATSFYNIGLVQDNMGDCESSLQSYLSALKISFRLYGGHHPHPTMIQERINLHPFCPISRGGKEHCPKISKLVKVLAPVKRSLALQSKKCASKTLTSYHKRNTERCSSSLCSALREKEQHSETLQFRFFG